MKIIRKLAFLLLALPCFGQQINPNQIQPASVNSYVLTTVTAGLPPSWQPSAGSAVNQIIAGPCISLSPSDGLGTVTITNSCTPSAGITPVQVILATSAIAANTCVTQTAVTMTGVVAPSGTTPGSVFSVIPESNPAAVNGWGSTGGLVMQVWATANTLNYNLCNQSGNSITPGALTVDVSAGSGGSSGSGTLTSFAAPSGSWPSWLVPTVSNSTTTPSLAVAASGIPNSALSNFSITLGTTTINLGGTTSSAAGFTAAFANALTASPTTCGSGNAPQGVDTQGNVVGCQAIGGGGGSGPVLQVNGTPALSQILQNLVSTSTVAFTNPSGGVINATVPTSTPSTLGVSSPDNTTISATAGVYKLISPGAGTIVGFSSGNTYTAYTAGPNISLTGNLISNTSPANAITASLTAGTVPVSTGGVNFGASTITTASGSTIIGSGTTSNTDGWGHVTLSSQSTFTLTFSNTYASAPDCSFIPQFNPLAYYWPSYIGTTQWVMNFSNPVSGIVTYHCDKHT